MHGRPSGMAFVYTRNVGSSYPHRVTSYNFTRNKVKYI